MTTYEYAFSLSDLEALRRGDEVVVSRGPLEPDDLIEYHDPITGEDGRALVIYCVSTDAFLVEDEDDEDEA